MTTRLISPHSSGLARLILMAAATAAPADASATSLARSARSRMAETISSSVTVITSEEFF